MISTGFAGRARLKRNGAFLPADRAPGGKLALFRVLRQGKAPEEAQAEMQIYGFGRGHRRMVAFFHRRTSGAGAIPAQGG